MEAAAWLTSYQQRLDDIEARARHATDTLGGLTASGSGGNGAVTVTVNASGALHGVSFGERADEMTRPRLAEAVLEASRKARAAVARQAAAALEPLIGGSEASRYLAEHVPPDTAEDGWR